jgi:hypothetical protein
MHPRSTNSSTQTRDVYRFGFESTGALELDNEYDGATNPNEIPLAVKLRQFVRSYDGQLDTQLSKNDLSRLIKAIRETAKLEGLNIALAALPLLHMQSTSQGFRAKSRFSVSCWIMCLCVSRYSSYSFARLLFL